MSRPCIGKNLVQLVLNLLVYGVNSVWLKTKKCWGTTFLGYTKHLSPLKISEHSRKLDLNYRYSLRLDFDLRLPDLSSKRVIFDYPRLFIDQISLKKRCSVFKVMLYLITEIFKNILLLT